MAFFDNLSKKVSQVSQATAQKVKEVAEVAKLNSAVSDEEKKVNDLYLEIGKLYVANHGDAPEEAFAGMINALREAGEKIVEYRRQIQVVKGVQVCEKCGAEVPNGVAFCSACGTAMPKAEQEAPAEAAEDRLKCASCGALVGKDMRFCTACGAAMAQEAAPVAEEPTAAEEAAPAEDVQA